MKVSSSFSQGPILKNTTSTIDLIIDFKGDENTKPKFRRPLNLSIVLDRSGSMAGMSLRYAIQAAQKLLDYLTEEDYLSVVIYDDAIDIIVPPQLVTDKQTINNNLKQIYAGGCTNLHGGWLRGCELVKSQQQPERINRVLLLTDGHANVGNSNPQSLIQQAKQQSDLGIITTTLGFGSGFNEDLLIGMADAGLGNFYYIQSPEDASDVFRIEIESILSAIAQNLSVTIEPEKGVNISQILHNYNVKTNNNKIEIFLGDVYGLENKQLAVELTIKAPNKIDTVNLGTINYQYQTTRDDKLETINQKLPLAIATVDENSKIVENREIIEQTSQLRIAKVKDEAIILADKGNYEQASNKLRQIIEDLKAKSLQETFNIAEEIEQLEHYAETLATGRFNNYARKEMRDQSYQALRRDREELKLRGSASGSAHSLEIVRSADSGVLLKCEKEGGKLRIKVISEGYNPELNVQFPRNIREAGVTYLVDEIVLAGNGSFYRASGKIRRFLKPGENLPTTNIKTGAANLKPISNNITAADLETTTSVDDKVLVQCIKEGSKLRARVVSDNYNPNYNIRFPRSIREESILYVVDEVKETPQGGSYIAYGKIRRLIQ
jgi:Ca-activated chloride channel family protein